jgi:hypothetical protein
VCTTTIAVNPLQRYVLRSSYLDGIEGEWLSVQWGGGDYIEILLFCLLGVEVQAGVRWTPTDADDMMQIMRWELICMNFKEEGAPEPFRHDPQRWRPSPSPLFFLFFVFHLCIAHNGPLALSIRRPLAHP